MILMMMILSTRLKIIDFFSSFAAGALQYTNQIKFTTAALDARAFQIDNFFVFAKNFLPIVDDGDSISRESKESKLQETFP